MKIFKDYGTLKPKEKRAFRKRILDACFIEPSTWYRWMQKQSIPKPSQKLISQELGQPIEDLFTNN